MEKKNKNYFKAKEYLDKAIELLKNSEGIDSLKNGAFEQSEDFVQKTIGLLGTQFALLRVVGEINTKDRDKVRLALETLGFICLRKNAYHAATQSLMISDILLKQMIENKSFKHVTDKYKNYMFKTSFFMDFTKGMHNWIANNFEAAQTSFKRAIFRLDKETELIRYLEKILLLIDADSKFMSLLVIDKDPVTFYEKLSEIEYWEVKKNTEIIYKIEDRIADSLPEVRDVILGRGICVALYTHFLRTIFDLLLQLENVPINDELIKKIKDKFSQIKDKNEVLQFGENFLFECINAMTAYGGLKDIPEHRYRRLMNLLHPIWATYSEWMVSLLKKETRDSFFKKNILQLTNQIDPLVLLVYEEKKPEYARMWTSETKSQGKGIKESEFNKLVENKNEYKIFIVDRGEYEMRSIGEVYLNNILILKQDSPKTKKEKDKQYLMPFGYRLLVYTLKNKYRAGTIIELIEKCWEKKSLIDGPDGLREKLKEDKDTFARETSTYRKTIANLSTLLDNAIAVQLRSYKTGSWGLTGKPKFCLLEIRL